jgi:hypothetical protein
MTRPKGFSPKLKVWLGTFWLALLFTVAVAAQTSAPPVSTKPEQGQSAGENGPSNTTPDQAGDDEHGKKISQEEAQELFGQVDQILKFASKDSGLPIKHEVKRRLTNREEVVAYLQKSMREDKSAKRVERSEMVLKKFGLVPRDFKLSSFMVALLREQIAGYYDPKTKTKNLLNWVPVEQQRPVMAHELTHALQDQSLNLQKWLKAGEIDIDKKKDLTPADFVSDEMDEVKEAVVEGQAEAVMLDYVLAPSGRSVTNAPEVIAILDADMMAGSPDSLQFKNAPIFMKESLTFPYRYGVKFVAAVLKAQDRDRAFAGVLRNPPRITRQIMEPQTYLSGEIIPPMPLPDFKRDFKDYDRFDVGAIGEFDVSMLVDQYAGVPESRLMYPSWRGGYYYSALPKGNPAGPLGLLYISRWATPEKAQEFGAIYAMALPQRYKHVDPAGENQLSDLAAIHSLSGKHSWETEDGTVLIEVKGDTVFVSESLDAATNEALRHDVFATAMATEALAKPAMTTQ